VSARFVTGKVLGSLATLFFVICFNFFLFRVVEGDPVASLFRGRNLTATQREALTKQFGLDGSTGEQFVRYLEQTAQLNLGRSYSTNQPVSKEIASKAWATIALVGISTLLSTVFGVLIGIAAAWRRRTKADYTATTFTMATYSMPDFWLGMLLLSFFAVTLGWFPVGGIEDASSNATGVAHLAVLRPEHRDDEERGTHGPLGEVGERLDRGGVRELEVVEHQQHRTATAPGAEEPRDRCALCLAGLERDVGELRTGSSQRAIERSLRVLVGRIAARVHHDRAGLTRLDGELGDEARLPAAFAADDRDELARAGERSFPRCVELGQLLVAPDEPGPAVFELDRKATARPRRSRCGRQQGRVLGQDP